MPAVTVLHQSTAFRWPSPERMGRPHTLVLGSFNPYDNQQQGLDYYYGRSTNYFWKCLAELTGKESTYFFAHPQAKLEFMQDRFCCMDVIQQIEINGLHQETLSEFVRKKIFTDFADQDIWTSKTRFKSNESKHTLNLRRTYNPQILEYLKTTESVKTVIHTMSDRIISPFHVEPLEKKLGGEGFSGYMNSVFNICKQREINFIFQSFSPSQAAVNRNNPTREELSNWLRLHLLI